MTLDQFLNSISAADPPAVGAILLALWHDAKGDWESSHNLIQDIDSKQAALVHAYLHRREGDIWNADYWYARAGAKRKEWTLREEWEYLVKKHLPS